MKQVFHLFRKDVRHHWIVIMLCQAALAMYGWNEVNRWSDGPNFRANDWSNFIALLLVVCWSLFILRVVQDESLVGDRQFWVTRPYEWKKLLAEKLLMVLVFLHLPLLIVGTFLLAKAGFPPAPHLLGLLWMQVLLLQLPFLPLLALAAVTRNLVQGVVTLLAAFLATVGINMLPGFFRAGTSHFYTTAAYGFYFAQPHGPRTSDLQGVALILACLGAVGLQYTRRKTVASRAWLIAGVAAMAIITLASAYARRNRDPFPIPNHPTIAFQAGLDPVKLLPSMSPVDKDEGVSIGIPMSASGIPLREFGWIRGIRLVLETPDGFRWDGRWPGSIEFLQSGDNRWRAMFQMDYEAYQRLHSAPLTAHISTSVDVFRESRFETVAATDGEFSVPGVGRCRIWQRDQRSLHCNSPLTPPGMAVVRVEPASSTCLDKMVLPPAAIYGLPYSWERRFSSASVEYGVSPIATSFFTFGYFSDLVQICPGTPLIFSLPELVENVRSDSEIEGLHLDDYRQSRFSSNPITAPDGVRLGMPPPPR